MELWRCPECMQGYCGDCAGGDCVCLHPLIGAERSLDPERLADAYGYDDEYDRNAA